MLSQSIDLTALLEKIEKEEVREGLYWVINGIDIINCELAQNIAKKLKEK